MIPKFRAYSAMSGIEEITSMDFENEKLIVNNCFYGKSVPLKFDEVVIMQSTGLRNLNGVDIFEGDIGWDPHQECYGEVSFENGGFMYKWENITQELFDVKNDIEIIGNIYENSELLEESE